VTCRSLIRRVLVRMIGFIIRRLYTYSLLHLHTDNTALSVCRLRNLQFTVAVSCRRTELELASYSLYNLRADHTENSASIFETCLPSHCIATVAALTTANPLLRALSSNEQRTLVLLLLHVFRGFCVSVAPAWDKHAAL
jgi:hypothetical protein